MTGLAKELGKAQDLGADFYESCDPYDTGKVTVRNFP